MGNSQVQQPPQLNNLSHLTSDPQYQQLLRQLYANNSPNIAQEFPQFRGNFNYNPNRNRRNLEIKKTKPIKNDMYIHKSSIKVVSLYLNKKQLKKVCEDLKYYLTFQFDCQTTININLYFPGKETVDTNNLTTKVESKLQKQFTFGPGYNQQLHPQSFQIDYNKYTLEQLSQFDLATHRFPLIVRLGTPDKRTMTYYCSFQESKQANIPLIASTVRIKVEKNGKAFLANDIYGNNDKEDIDDKDCVICMTQKIDTMIIPCKHMSLCLGCCEDLRERDQRCPICRRTIERFIKVEKLRRSTASQPIIQEENKEEKKEETIETNNQFIAKPGQVIISTEQPNLIVQDEVKEDAKEFKGKGVLIG